MLKALSEADIGVKAELARIGEGTLLKKGLEVRREQLRGVQGRIDEIVRDLKSNQTLLMKDAVKTSFQNGIEGGICIPYLVDTIHEFQPGQGYYVFSHFDWDFQYYIPPGVDPWEGFPWDGDR